MCEPGQPPARPATAGEALAVLEGALDYLNGTNAASLPAAEQASALKVLERAESKHTAARAAILAAFTAQGTFGDDGQHSARAWLTGSAVWPYLRLFLFYLWPSFLPFTLAPHYQGIAAHPCRRQAI